MRTAYERAKKQVSSEYRRQWRNRERELSEAIRKMEFVKVELLSELRFFAKLNGSASGGTPSAQASEREKNEGKQLLASASDGAAVFPFDGVVWPDELFKLRSVAAGQCLQALR